MRFAVAAAVIGLAAAAARAETIVVPSDEHPTIQSAVDAAAEGDLVLVNPGTYEESVAVSTYDLQIRARGKVILSPGPGNDGFDLQEVGGVTLQGFTIRGAATGVFADASFDCRLVKLVIEDVAGIGIHLDNSDDVLISRCRVTGCGEDGVRASGSSRPVVERSVFADCVADSLHLNPESPDGAAPATVSRNRITGGNYGVNLGGEGSLVERNVIEAGGQFAIFLPAAQNCEGTIIDRNRCRSGGAVGISVAGAGVSATRNSMLACAIYLAGSGVVADRNRVAGGVFGVYADGSVGGATVARNRVSDVSAFGIRVQGNSPATVIGNSIATTGQEGLAVSNHGSTVDGNRVKGAGDYGLVMNGTGCTVTGNSVRGSGTLDLADGNPEGANSYEGNRFGTTGFNQF